ncbi:sulfatase-like hydrolase/transferase [Paracoccus xiamenensis]|uniref:sulfatase-like hydrolase/transferase n=1 Tax=Paracoccus xiamenensis TaxID=2714901 RepID=UPI0014098247|nr:sulfatase-like hydrolase/transferase [Paracoccus xiamenensis]NHF72010.1 sulfatase-like hydrolase/transferase [Paracoccus xiamenensis]
MSPAYTRVRPAQVVLAALVIWLVLVLPNHPGKMTPATLLTFPLELPALLLVMIALGQRPAARLILTLLLVLLTALKLADLVTYQVLDRPFNPVADLPLLDAALRIVAGTFGVAAAAFSVLAAGALLLGLAAAIWWALGIWSHLDRPGPLPALAALASMAILAAYANAPTGAWGLPIATDSIRLAAQRTALAQRTYADLRQFRRMARGDPFADRPELLNAIDSDVLVIFLESYGRTSFDTPFYAETHLPILRRAEADLARAGLAMRSGFLTSPTQGGQSWLAHASFANGLAVSDQSRYLAALASGRQTLFHHAQRAGFRTAAVMPAITRPWPEARRMGFDRVLAADDLGYRGKPFNWVTMPDQFTLAASDRLLGGDHDRRLFAQIALISSHAPWVPVPEMVDWDAVGDGRVFDAMAEAGDPPRVVWRDPERVRQQYRKAISYTLQAVAEYALRHADDPPLLIVLGDHQAAASIAQDARRDVPIHIIGPKALVERSTDWGFTPGLVPPAGTAAIPMEAMRDLILHGFSGSLQTPPA